MPEEVVTAPPVTEPAPTTTVQPDISQFAENIWNDAPPAQQPTPVTQPVPDQPVIEPAKPEPKIVGVDEWLKETYGWENADAGKAELERLRQLQQQAATPAEIKFANDEAKRYYEAITNGKADDLYNMLHQQRQLSRLEQLEIKSATEAAEIIKANLQFKHRDLKPEQIDRLYTRQYAIPAKPIQNGEDDTEYAAIVADWQRQVQEKEQDIMIDAQIAKPELLKYKSELVLPDIPQPQQQSQGPTQEELDRAAAWRTGVNQAINADYKNFNGFNVVYKDKEVEIPISYTLDDNEKAALRDSVLKDVFGDNFDVNAFFGNRWFDKEGKPNVQLIMADRYLLDNREKVLQKVANDAANKRLDHQIKTQNKITVGNGSQSQTTLDSNNREKLMEELANVAFQ